MKKFLFIASRVIVGAVFLLSGFVKAVDPAGSAIKFTDYFSAFHIEWLDFSAYPLAIILATLEFLTGAHLILGLRNKLFGVLATIFMAIFTPITLYIAIANPVTDCGCFGDAYKLSNWQTFFKNLILLLPTLFVLKNRREFQSSLNGLPAFITSMALIAVPVYVSLDAINHLPALDFRPYHIGANIQTGMEIPEGAEQAVYETTFTLEKNGERKEFSTENYPYTDTTWVFIDSKTKTISEGYQPPIHDFVLIDDDGNDKTSELLSKTEATLLIVSSQIKDAKWDKTIENLKEIRNLGLSKGIETFVLTASSNQDITELEFSTDAGFHYLTGDETMIKTIIRSNPGLVLLQDGNIIGKWHYNDIPLAKNFDNPVSYSLKERTSKENNFWLWCIILGTTFFITVNYMSKKK